MGRMGAIVGLSLALSVFLLVDAEEDCAADGGTQYPTDKHKVTQDMYKSVTAAGVGGVASVQIDESTRFQLMRDRNTSTSSYRDFHKKILTASYRNHWRGVGMMKDALQMQMYPNMIQELRPRTIIETGIFQGGSSMWLADTAKAILGDHFHKVLAFDISLANVREDTKSHPHIEFLEFGNADMHLALRPRLAELPRPLLVIEDSHYDFPVLLKFIHEELLQPGDYLTSEDPNPVAVSIFNEFEEFDQHENELILAKGPQLRELCIKHEDKYRVDAKYCDMFGYNSGKFFNSIVKRIA